MPSSPKNKPRREKDNYSTPIWVIETLLNDFPLMTGETASGCKRLKIVEPCSGAGNISSTIKRFYPDCELVQYEIRPEEERGLSEFGSIQIGDFLSVCEPDDDVDFVITNPPFTYSQEFIEKCLIDYPMAQLIFLMPLSFLGSDKRHDFWIEAPLTGLKVLSDRPSFTEDGKTDSSVYAWYFFRTRLMTPINFLSKLIK